ncbi:hypothetical protein CTM_17831 [Clostridium tetanomorphum DSM 665]|uniref:DUF4912 domain-containing protein n=2 Tax=Clostridium tetanomorphum TaxID=1553 RepID=A0A923J0G7_CLOTT|nr:DUF4912 domain-containing protein [Clostridium tetanomorphum]KAJ49193.1 hypothetical protein CTM_24493 [Clostridium tetanomorphum DSM 665]KAJ50500.1 hypothetical protein CTM_17831 [Clostridium tetanomorphum DSM 665]MBC2398291.1 DUF4912 domain-containing protein [Clostridium tetanomorphum]NRZ96088.1 hypothetical protein [Clostridium tetanomorphum]SQB89876.1 Uncharacterised protein [Clostridium tetanomorphum]
MLQVDKSKIILMVQSANIVFCYFHISPIILKEFQDKYGEDAMINSKPALKIYCINNNIVTELETIFMHPLANNWYIHLDKAPMNLYVKIGRVLPDNSFVTFCISNIVTTPRKSQSEDKRVYYIDIFDDNK